MKNEITVRMNGDLDHLDKQLKKLHFKQIEDFDLDDIYFISNTVNTNIMKFQDILKRCLILRKNRDSYKIIYKEKDYSDNGDILDQKDFDFTIYNRDNTIKYFESLNYKVLINVFDQCRVYYNGKFSLITQWVNHAFLFIEMENTSPNYDYEFETIEEMISEFKKLKLDYDDTNYFVSKAELIYEK